MFCGNCGTKLGESAKFCPGCGAPVEPDGPAEAPVPETPPTETAPAPAGAVVQTPAPGEETPAGGTSTAEEPVLTQGAVLTQEPPPTEKKGRGKTLIAIIAAAVVVVVAAVVGVISLLSGGGNKTEVIGYVNDNYELMFLENTKEKTEALEISDEAAAASSFRVSPDGDYVYFREFDDPENAYVGDCTLMRMEISKIGKEGAKAEKVDSDVTAFSFLDGGDLFYAKYDDDGNADLYRYDGEEKLRLVKGVSDYQLDSAETYLYYTEEEDETLSLYRIPLSGDGEEERLLKDVDYIYSDYDADVLVYGEVNRSDDAASAGETVTVYTCTPGGDDKTEVTDEASEVFVSRTAGGKVTLYYDVRVHRESTLYDFVTDTRAADDEALLAAGYPEYPAEPSLYDYYPSFYYYYTNENYEFYQEFYGHEPGFDMTEYYFEIIDLSAYYAGIEERYANFYERFLWYDEFEPRYWLYNNTGIFGYETGYGSWVLFEEAAAIGNGGQAMDKVFDVMDTAAEKYTAAEKEYEASLVAYEEACLAYDEAARRQDLREELREWDYSTVSSNIYRYEDGKSTEIITDWVDGSSAPGSGVFLYTKLDAQGGKVADIEELEYPEQADELLEEGGTDAVWYVNVGGVESEMEFDAKQVQYIDEIFVLNGEEVVVSLFDGEDLVLEAYRLEENGLTFISSVSDDYVQLQMGAAGGKEALYFYEDWDADKSEGDLVCYSGGVSETVVKGIYQYFVLADSGTVYTWGEMDSDKEGRPVYELSVKQGDEWVKVTDECRDSNITFLDAKQVLYIEDDDLFLWNGKENRRIARDVLYYWAAGVGYGSY